MDRSKDYELIENLGSGNFGTVSKERNRRTNEIVAIKTIKKIIDKSAYNEIYILKELTHDNIIRYVDHYSNKNGLAIVMEYADRGTMYDNRMNMSLRSKIMATSENSMWVLLNHLSSALSYLHEKGIMHCDLKPDNILCFPPKDQVFHFKLADFGIAQKLVNSRTRIKFYKNNVIGNHEYMAPEVLRVGRYTKSADMWSVGAIACFWYNGEPLFKDCNEVLHWKGGVQLLPRPPTYYSTKELKSVLDKLLIPKEGSFLRRADAKSILAITTAKENIKTGWGYLEWMLLLAAVALMSLLIFLKIKKWK